MALARGEEVLAELQVRHPRSHSERLLPNVEALLAAAGMKISEVAAVAVSTGPGSFTGLRIGLAAAKGLAFSLGIPLYGIPTLELLAANGAHGSGTVCPLLDARRGEVFSALFRFDGGEAVRLAPERISGPEELLSTLPRGTLIVGDLPSPLASILRERGLPFSVAPPHLAYPRAAVAALMGWRFLSRGRPGETNPVPLYLRPSDAEAGRGEGKRKAKET